MKVEGDQEFSLSSTENSQTATTKPQINKKSRGGGKSQPSCLRLKSVTRPSCAENSQLLYSVRKQLADAAEANSAAEVAGTTGLPALPSAYKSQNASRGAEAGRWGGEEVEFCDWRGAPGQSEALLFASPGAGPQREGGKMVLESTMVW